MPADGTTAATVGNGDFGTSPVFGQLLGKPLLAYNCLCRASDAKHNSRSINWPLGNKSSLIATSMVDSVNVALLLPLSRKKLPPKTAP